MKGSNDKANRGIEDKCIIVVGLFLIARSMKSEIGPDVIQRRKDTGEPLFAKVRLRSEDVPMPICLINPFIPSHWHDPSIVSISRSNHVPPLIRYSCHPLQCRKSRQKRFRGGGYHRSLKLCCCLGSVSFLEACLNFNTGWLLRANRRRMCGG